MEEKEQAVISMPVSWQIEPSPSESINVLFNANADSVQMLKDQQLTAPRKKEREMIK